MLAGQDILSVGNETLHPPITTKAMDGCINIPFSKGNETESGVLFSILPCIKKNRGS
jgi:hypothetical protein